MIFLIETTTYYGMGAVVVGGGLMVAILKFLNRKKGA
jgi:hypothetical protein